MAFPEDIFPPDECCEICGIQLDDEVVVQEFADGSLVRLCPECAAGTAFEAEPQPGKVRPPDAKPAAAPAVSTTPAPSPSAAAASGATPTLEVAPDPDPDPLDRTKELLVPVTDLISLQTEVQATLERLAASLERFATEVIAESNSKTADVEKRLHTLEAELEKTRTRLSDTESLIVVSAGSTDPEPDTEPSPAAEPEPAAEEAAEVVEESPFQAADAAPIVPPPVDEEDEYWPAAEEDGTDIDDTADITAAQESPLWPGDSAPAEAPGPAETPAGESLAAQNTWAASASTPAEPASYEVPEGTPPEVFSLEEIQLVQRVFNESPFTERIRAIRRSLGRPKANLSRIQGAEPRVLITVLWDIVWYQYLVSLRQDASADERVALFREGMDLEELAPYFQEKNASIDDEGRLDASELEVRLLSDPTVLITEMDPSEEKALEDATEEIWDQKISPEFKWDD